jgi:hypothetical protein
MQQLDHQAGLYIVHQVAVVEHGQGKEQRKAQSSRGEELRDRQHYQPQRWLIQAGDRVEGIEVRAVLEMVEVEL